MRFTTVLTALIFSSLSSLDAATAKKSQRRQVSMLTGPPMVTEEGIMVKVAELNPPGAQPIDLFFNMGKTPARLVRREGSTEGEAAKPSTTSTTSLRQGAIGVEVTVSITLGEENGNGGGEGGAGEGGAGEGGAGEGGAGEGGAGEGEAGEGGAGEGGAGGGEGEKVSGKVMAE